MPNITILKINLNFNNKRSKIDIDRIYKKYKRKYKFLLDVLDINKKDVELNLKVNVDEDFVDFLRLLAKHTHFGIICIELLDENNNLRKIELGYREIYEVKKLKETNKESD